jgi:hypothetical protein
MDPIHRPILRGDQLDLDQILREAVAMGEDLELEITGQMEQEVILQHQGHRKIQGLLNQETDLLEVFQIQYQTLRTIPEVRGVAVNQEEVKQEQDP